MRCGSSLAHSSTSSRGARRRADLDADRVVDAGEERRVRAVGLPRALADPEHVRRAVVPVAGQRVAAREALLVVQHEALVARPDVDLVQLGLAREVDAAGGHEAQRALDLARDLLVAAALGRARDELLVPLVHARDVGEAALRERAQQVERARRLVVGAQHALRVVDARLGRGRVVVDQVAVERRQVDVADALGGRRARLRELAGDAPHLDHRQRRRVGQDDRHLQQDPQLLADRDRGGVVERLGAVTGLEQERAPGGDLGERVLQRPRLAREHERRHPAQLARGRSRPARRRATRAAAAPRARCQDAGVQGVSVTAIRPLSLRREGVPAPRHARARSRAARRAPARGPRRARPRRAGGTAVLGLRRRPGGPGRSPARAGAGPAARR